MENPPNSAFERGSFLKRLEQSEPIIKVEQGLSLIPQDYPLAEVPEGSSLQVEDLRDSAIGFLNANIVADSFQTHGERIAWYNESGVLAGESAKFYLANKLRMNVLLGFLNAAQTYGEYFSKGHDRKRFFAPTILFELVKDIDLADYDQYTVEEKMSLVARLENAAKIALNEMIDFGWITGEKLEV
jgi:hypothetical protein